MSEPTAFGKLIQGLADLLDEAASAPRAEVVRTQYDKPREPIPNTTRATVLRRDKYRCVWCGDRRCLQMDHIVPWSAGGTDDVSNLRTLCVTCNMARSNRLSQLDLADRVPYAPSCLKCTPDESADGSTPVWCMNCCSRGLGWPNQPREWHFDRAAVESCDRCDPSGWVETPVGLARCWHHVEEVDA